MGYTQVKVSISPELASSFKAACMASGVSMTTVLAKFMADYCRMEPKPKPADYSTRRLRRSAVKRLVRQLEIIRGYEKCYRDNIPENLQNSSVYETADESVMLLEEAAEILASVY